jgi:transcriptional regulator with XRE-family HTH domain
MPIALPSKPRATNAKLVRVAHGWTLDEVALAAGVNRSYLSRIERGRERPSGLICRRLAGVLGMALQDDTERA